MLNDDGDIVRGLGFVALYSAYLEEQIDNLLVMLSAVQDFTEEEQRWPVSRKIKKAKQIAANFNFEGRDDLVAILDEAKDAFEERNKIVHGRIYGNFDRPDTLKSGRPNVPDRQIVSAELYELANHFSGLQGEVYRPMISIIPRALAGNGNTKA